MTSVNLKFLTDYDYPSGNVNKLYKDTPNIFFLKDNLFNYWNNSVILNDNYTKTFYIEGMSDDNNSEYIILYDNRFKKLSKESKLVLDDLNYDTSVKILKDGVIIELYEINSLGEIIGNVNIKNCGITNPEDIEIVCLSNDSKRLIGRYDVVNGTYKIPNLDANKYYDIILVDKSRKVEQQVLSYRKPTPY